MIEIDGSQGEGGGQVLRTSLTLSALTRTAVSLVNIRAGRKQPGLQAQHLTSVNASQAICKAEVQGAQLGSTRLVFSPATLRSGRYRFEIPTAGSTGLVLQTIFFPLSYAGSSSSVIISGGTHVAWAPCFHYLELQWLPVLIKMGWNAHLTLDQAGYYPQGGGRISAVISPTTAISPLQITERGKLQSIRGITGVSNLELSIAERMKRQAVQRLQKHFQASTPYRLQIKVTAVQSPFKGAFIILLVEYEHGRGCFTGLGALGKLAERVADEAVDELIDFDESQSGVDPYLADQLLLPLALAADRSQIMTSSITQHLVTNAEIIRQFLSVGIQIDGEIGQPGMITVTPPNR